MKKVNRVTIIDIPCTRFGNAVITILLVQDKNFPGDPEEPNEVPEADEETKSFFSDNSLEFGKSSDELSWNPCTSTPHKSETNGIVDRAVRSIKEGTSAVLWILWNVTAISETFKISSLREDTI